MKIQKKHVVLASLVLALGAAVYINWQISATPDNIDTKELGKATYVNSNVQATVDESEKDLVSSLTKEQQNYFSNARLKRDKISDEIKSTVLEVLEITESDEDVKEEALEQLSNLQQRLANQITVENTLMAKGFTDCVCSLSDGTATVIVPEGEITDKSTLIIKDAVSKAGNVTFDNISIVTV